MAEFFGCVILTIFVIINCVTFTVKSDASTDDAALVFTVATSETDGFLRYLQSAQEYKIHPKVLGLGQEWKGGENIKNNAGGGWKINLLKAALEPYTDSKDKIVLFTDAYDVMFVSELTPIVNAFKKTGARVLFGAEAFCWPDQTLAVKYPEVKALGKPYLNSGMFIGYIDELVQLLNKKPVEDTDDDQLFFTQAYLDEDFRQKIQMKLDHESEVFQNLNGAVNEVELSGDGKEQDIVLKNVVSHTQPLVIHGNGPSKWKLNYLGNYLGRAWNASAGCRYCKWGQINLDNFSQKPVVLLSIFIEQATPFLDTFLTKIAALEYPKEKIHLFIHTSVKYHKELVGEFVGKFKSEYLSIKEIQPEDGVTEWSARDLALDHCLRKDCDYYFGVDSVAHLDNPYTLKLLVEQNRTVLAPLLVRPGKAWSNFWGALTSDGFYARSDDYMDIVYSNKRGLWNVPFINAAYLINATLLKKYDRSKLHFTRGNLDADMAFCANLRDLDVFLWVSNRVEFGHLVTPDSYDVSIPAPDMYQIFENERDWEEKYINPSYPENFNPEKTPAQPCPDVYWFPIVTRQFCNDLIHMMESFGKWSDGKNTDPRLDGGYEAVPTRDIHMNQVGWERHWLHFLQKYVRPIQEHVFTGYFHDPPRSLMNFVVRYRPGEQPSLRPHHDSSTYTINIALNERGVDYEGGGCRFIRYNCSVVDTRPGWLLMHPGRLTHYHEGLLVTKGTRYIMIAFVDP